MRSFIFAGAVMFLTVTIASATKPGAGFLPVTDRKWVPTLESVARGLSQHDARGPCSMPLIQMAEPASVEEYMTCRGTMMNETDFTVAGANFDVLHTCWCNHNMHELMTEFQCCDHPDFALLCTAECEPDCESEVALGCLEKCPAICLEGDYAPADICSECTHDHECTKYLKCIVKHSKDRTAAGDPDHPNICDDRKFDESPEYLAWQDCYVDHPMRTHWHRTNAEHHCYCKSNLKNAAETHGCCGATWAGKICHDGCDEAESMCATEEAQECLEDCRQKCAALHPANMVEECKTHCVDEDSKCEKYKICAPVGEFEHEYICDDGSTPPANGCCHNDLHTGIPMCPGMCDSAVTHIMHHGPECKCTGCPEDHAAAKSKFNSTLYNNLREHGWMTLTDLARRHKLDHPNQKMQDMMSRRNEEIMAAWQEHPGAIDTKFQEVVNQISKKWRDLMEAEAIRQAKYGDETPAPTPAPVLLEKEAEKSGGLPVIIIICASVGGLLLIFGILVMVYKIKATSKAASGSGGAAGNVTPQDGDPNVVVGRPVEGDQVAATEGTTLSTGKGGDAPAKGEAPPQFGDAEDNKLQAM